MVYRTKVQQIAGLIDARLTGVKTGNENWQDTHEYQLEILLSDILPSGSGIDLANTINYDKSRPDRIVIDSAYHIMDSEGFYREWIVFQVIITPDLQFGFVLKIVGKFSKNKHAVRSGLKNELEELYTEALRED